MAEQSEEASRTCLDLFSEKWGNFVNYVRSVVEWDKLTPAGAEFLEKLLAKQPLEAIPWLELAVLPWYDSIMQGNYPLHLKELNNTQSICPEIKEKVLRYLACFNTILAQ